MRQRWTNYARVGSVKLPLEGDDRLSGILDLIVVDSATGEQLVAGVFIEDMDISADQKRVTMTVNSDIG